VTLPRLVLHIGQHKTGSKAVQSFLAHNAGRYQEQGILYPVEETDPHGISAYANSHFRLYVLLKRECLNAAGNTKTAAEFWAKHKIYCNSIGSTDEFFKSLASERARAAASQVVISAEDLFDMQSAHETDFSLELVAFAASRLHQLITEYQFEPRVIVYLRRQDHLLCAHYAQYIKGSLVHTETFDEFRQAFAPRLESFPILHCWSEAFGTQNIQVRAYEQATIPAGTVTDFNRQILQCVRASQWPTPPVDPESTNPTPGRDFIEYFRLLNAHHAGDEHLLLRKAVLETALESSIKSQTRQWLSPTDQLALLSSHANGNTRIAREFLGREDGTLFSELPPDPRENWTPYPGLSAETTLAISVAAYQKTLGLQPRPQGRFQNVIRRLLGRF